MSKQTLSPKSPFEQTFKTRYRGPGRPSSSDTFEPVDAHPLLKKQAQRRAFAVVHENSKDDLNEIFLAELAVLKRRGVEQVAKDCNIVLGETDA